MSIGKDLISASKRDELMTFALKEYLGNLGDIFKFSTGHLVNTDPFQRYKRTSTQLSGGEHHNDNDGYARVDIKYETVAQYLKYFGEETTLGSKANASRQGIPFDLPMDTVSEHIEQAVINIHKDMATSLTASSFAAAQKDAATGAWSGSDTVLTDVKKIKTKLHTSAKRRADRDEAVKLVMSYDVAQEALATTKVQTWLGTLAASNLVSDEEKLAKYLSVNEVIILDAVDKDGNSIYTNICDFVVVDRRNLNGAITNNSGVLPANHSGLLIAFLESDLLFTNGSNYFVNVNGAETQFTKSMVSSLVQPNRNGDTVVTTKGAWKVYSHQPKSLVGLTGL